MKAYEPFNEQDAPNLDANTGLLPFLCQHIAIFAVQTIQNIIVSFRPLEPKDVLMGLGKNCWKECIDGIHWKHGSDVYDKGRHNSRKKEPGYLEGMRKGRMLAQGTILQPLTVASYKRLHHTCCEHMQGAPSSDMQENEAGKFRLGPVHAQFDGSNFFPVSYDDQMEIWEALEAVAKTVNKADAAQTALISKPELEQSQRTVEDEESAIAYHIETEEHIFAQQLRSRIWALREEICIADANLRLSRNTSIVRIKNFYRTVFFDYPKVSLEDMEARAKWLFPAYEAALASADSLIKKLEVIYRFYTLTE